MKQRSPIGTTRRTSAFTIIVTFLALSLAGLSLMPLLPVKYSSSRVLPGFTVSFSMRGSSARVVEIEATSKLEGMLARIKGIRNMTSTSGNGWGRITIELDKHTNIEMARFEASTIVRQTWSELPDGVSYPTISMKQADNQSGRTFMAYSINAPSSPILIQQYAEENIKPQLSRLSGIYRVDVSGATPMEWVLEFDNEQLRRTGIDVSEIAQAIQQYYERESLGVCNIETARGQEWIRLALIPHHTSEGFDPSVIQVAQKEDHIVMLDELVHVTHVEARPNSYYRINGLNSIYLSITAEETANQLDLNNRIKAVMEQVNPTLPSGYEIHLSYDGTEHIRSELNKIYFRTGLTIVILLIFVLLITFSLRYLLLIVVSLTVNIAVAIIFYYLFKLEMQMYSLAGITVSLSLIIDNTVVMADHYLHRKNLAAFMAILAATLTTMGALVIIFFMDEAIRVNLQDFAAVVIINLFVSLFVALFFVPAMMDKINLHKHKLFKLRWLRWKIHFNRIYDWLIRFFCRKRAIVYILFILLFGLPTFLLPTTFGSETFKEKVRPILNKAFGGTLRLFVEKVYTGYYPGNSSEDPEVTISAYATLPQGSTLKQMNELVKKMESFVSEFKEIKQFHTSVNGPNNASIIIYVKDEYANTAFPFTLKNNIISKALQLGGGSWSVHANIPGDRGFSNDVRNHAGSYRVYMYGYNYDELYKWTEAMRDTLLGHRRIKDVIISSEFSYFREDYQEYFFDLNKQNMVIDGLNAYNLFGTLNPTFTDERPVGAVAMENGSERIVLTSKQSQQYDIWAMNNFPVNMGNINYKLDDVATVAMTQTPMNVMKVDQQYRLCIQYEYTGTSEQGSRILKRDVEKMNQILPLGYTIENLSDQYSWRRQNNAKNYLLLAIVILIIFFITSILFNSLRQPLAIIFLIPVSYIGVFLTFYWFKLGFDNGGFASFVLLCGITVNSGIYILNEYNALRRRFPRLKPLRAYIKAWNTKVIPICLTIITTILGFIPFMVGTGKERFWFPLAAGTIGGLVFSMLGVFVLLPMMTGLGLRQKKSRKKRKITSADNP